MKKKVLINGAGVAGITAAIHLDRSKFEVTLLERSETFNTQGFAVIPCRSAFTILERMFGPDPKWLHEIDYLNIATYSPIKSFYRTDMRGLWRSVKRDDLIKNLSDKYVEMHGKDEVLFNTSIKSIGKNSAELESGEKINFDLLIGADGANSVVRNHSFTSKEKPYYPVKYQWLKNGGNMKRCATGFFTSSHSGVIYTLGDETVVGYYSNGKDTKTDEEFEGELKTYLDSEFGGSLEFGKGATQYFETKLVDSNFRHDDTIVLIGDALHSIPPTTGFGTTAALEDAIQITDSLNNAGDIRSALDDFEEKRTTRLKEINSFQNRFEKFTISPSSSKLRVSAFLGDLFVSRYFEKQLHRHAGYVMPQFDYD